MTTDNACFPTATRWAAFIFSIISSNVTWWLLDLPMLWQDRTRDYFSSVTWQCLRLYMPAIAFILSAFAGRTPHERALIYYMGPHHRNRVREESAERALQPSRFQLAKAIGTDILSIIATGLTMYVAITRDYQHENSSVAVSVWMYPSLPVAVIGLHLLICAALSAINVWVVLTLGFVSLGVVGTALGVPLALLPKGGGLWEFAVAAFVLMSVPLGILGTGTSISLINLYCILMNVFYASLARFGAIGIAAVASSNSFTYCNSGGKPFGIVYLTIGGIGAAFSFVGWRLHWIRLHDITDDPPTRYNRWTTLRNLHTEN